MKRLKLFVWEDVLRDYTSGLVCVLAHDLEEALALIDEKDSVATTTGLGSPTHVVTEPAAFLVWGGG